MIRTATDHDLPALRELFRRANDSPYDLAAVAEEKCFGDGIAGAPVTRVIEDDGRPVAAAVHSGKWLRVLAVEREARRRGLGTRLLADANVTVIAAEPGNYFTPGVPLDDPGSLAFFRARGFVETQTTWNMHVSLVERRPLRPPVSPDDSAAEAAAARQVAVRRPRREEAERVLGFVEREFGRVWRFEAAKAFEQETPPAFVSEQAGDITGFVVHDVNNRGLGFFGPTGVARSMRGRGIGGDLLLASLHDLRALGYERVVIPWTDALDFYRKVCGATPAHRFATMVRA